MVFNWLKLPLLIFALILIKVAPYYNIYCLLLESLSPIKINGPKFFALIIYFTLQGVFLGGRRGDLGLELLKGIEDMPWALKLEIDSGDFDSGSVIDESGFWIRIGIGEFDSGLGLGIGIWIFEFGLRFEVRLFDWNLGYRLGIGNGDLFISQIWETFVNLTCTYDKTNINYEKFMLVCWFDKM